MRYVAILVLAGVLSFVSTASAERPSASAIGVLGKSPPTPASSLAGEPSARPPGGDELAVELIATRPLTPLVDLLEITVDSRRRDRMEVRSLTFVPRDVGADIVSFELAVNGSRGRQTIVVARDTTFITRPALRLDDDRVRVEVRAVDAQGTRSMPAIVDVDVDSQYRCGLGGVILGLARAFAALALVVVVVTILGRRRAPATGFIEPVSPLVADHIVRSVLRRSASASVAIVTGAVSATVLDHELLAVLLGFVALVPLGSLLAARRVARQLEAGGGRAEVRGASLVVHSVDGQGCVHASRGLIARARRQSVPASIVR